MSAKKRQFDHDDFMEESNEPAEKRRTTYTSEKNQASNTASNKFPFNDAEDNANYLSILNTLQTIYWENNNNNSNSLCSSSIIPGVVLQLIAEYSTGKIYQCQECDNKKKKH